MVLVQKRFEQVLLCGAIAKVCFCAAWAESNNMYSIHSNRLSSTFCLSGLKTGYLLPVDRVHFRIPIDCISIWRRMLIFYRQCWCCYCQSYYGTASIAAAPALAPLSTPPSPKTMIRNADHGDCSFFCSWQSDFVSLGQQACVARWQSVGV